jgi:exodeoxyribonuclease-5
MIKQSADLGHFSQPDHSKVIAWRNVTVDSFNRIIRQRIFPDAWHTAQWLEGDRALFSAPASDLEDKPLAKIDDEGTITRVTTNYHPIYTEFKTFEVSLTLDDGKPVRAILLHPDSQVQFNVKSADLAAAAKETPKKWRLFWEFKEAFHQLRYAYAITAHRSQGSTYHTAFVNYRDILINQDRKEALRCLYVAATRPKSRLILG